ncbi:MAG: PH domain-containing protein [Acidimicrobiales bacterium]
MPYPAENLNSQEKVVLDLRPHWWFFAKHVAILLATIVLGVLVLAFTSVQALNLIVGIAILGAVILFAFRYMIWTTTNFVVTTDRLISRSGVFTREGVEIPLERINTVFFRQNLFERMIGSGDLEIESASEEGSSLFTDIRRPVDVQNEIYHQMENNENRKFDRVGKNLSAQGFGGVGESIPDQIAKLDDLRKRGVLSDAEFQAKKEDLLRRM